MTFSGRNTKEVAEAKSQLDRIKVKTYFFIVRSLIYWLYSKHYNFGQSGFKYSCVPQKSFLLKYSFFYRRWNNLLFGWNNIHTINQKQKKYKFKKALNIQHYSKYHIKFSFKWGKRFSLGHSLLNYRHNEKESKNFLPTAKIVIGTCSSFLMSKSVGEDNCESFIYSYFIGIINIIFANGKYYLAPNNNTYNEEFEFEEN